MIISASVFWCTLEIFQCIVHEAKIPLVIKTKSSLVNRFGNTWKIGGIFCDQHGCRMKGL